MRQWCKLYVDSPLDEGVVIDVLLCLIGVCSRIGRYSELAICVVGKVLIHQRCYTDW
jgi:hypothetical protein